VKIVISASIMLTLTKLGEASVPPSLPLPEYATRVIFRNLKLGRGV